MISGYHSTMVYPSFRKAPCAFFIILWHQGNVCRVGGFYMDFNHLSPANAYAHYEPTISNHNTILTQKPAEYRAGHDLKSLEWTDQMPVQWIQSKQSLFCSIAHSILELWFNGTIGISSMHGDKSKWTHCNIRHIRNQLSYNCSIYRYRPTDAPFHPL